MPHVWRPLWDSPKLRPDSRGGEMAAVALDEQSGVLNSVIGMSVNIANETEFICNKRDQLYNHRL
jgi:hypothetical protein